MTDASLQAGRQARPRLAAGHGGLSGWRACADRVPLGLPRFLLAGGAISFINWLTRFPLSAVLPFWLAVAVAYVIGMMLGFELYRRWVFPGSTLPIGAQVLRFILVNLAGMSTVIGGAAAMVVVLRQVPLTPSEAEGMAHGMAIVAGAAVNFLGHRAVTFARRRMTPAG